MRVGVRQAGRQLSQLINRAVYGCERIVITSRGKPKAILLSVGEYERLGAKGGQRREVLIEAQELHETDELIFAHLRRCFRDHTARAIKRYLLHCRLFRRGLRCNHFANILCTLRRDRG